MEASILVRVSNPIFCIAWRPQAPYLVRFPLARSPHVAYLSQREVLATPMRPPHGSASTLFRVGAPLGPSAAQVVAKARYRFAGTLIA